MKTTGAYDCVTIPGAVKNTDANAIVPERICGRHFVTMTAMASTTVCSNFLVIFSRGKCFKMSSKSLEVCPKS